MTFIWGVWDEKYAYLQKKTIFGQKYTKIEFLEPFFDFFTPRQGSILTVKRSF